MAFFQVKRKKNAAVKAAFSVSLLIPFLKGDYIHFTKYPLLLLCMNLGDIWATLLQHRQLLYPDRKPRWIPSHQP